MCLSIVRARLLTDLLYRKKPLLFYFLWCIGHTKLIWQAKAMILVLFLCLKQKNVLHCNCVVLLQPLHQPTCFCPVLATGRQSKGLILCKGHGRVGKPKDRRLQSFCCKPPVWGWLEDFKEEWMALEHALAGECLVVSCMFAMCSPHCQVTNLSLFSLRTCQYFSL